MRGLSGLNKLVGFGLSMAMLAVAALVAIPAMIRSSGAPAVGAIVLGQTFGAIGAMVVAYGWGIAGPAEIARGDRASRTAEFLGSVKVRLVLLIPVMLATVVPSALLAKTRPDLAVVGALVAVLPGLTSNWFLIGLSRPYVLMLVETVPRVMFTVVGIVDMTTGSDAIIGLAWQGVGLVAAFVCSAVWILRFLKYRPNKAERVPKLMVLLRQYRHGVASNIGGSLFTALPLVIVNEVSLVAYPMFALVDKLQRQVLVALIPIVSVLQGWVPRVADPAPRAKKVVFIGAGLSVIIAMFTWAFGGWVMHVIGDGQVTPPTPVVIMMGVVLGLNFYAATLGHAVLATYRKMRELAVSTAVGTIVAMPLVALGAWQWGVMGALGAIAVGLVVQLSISLVVALRCIRNHEPVASAEEVALGPEEIV
jgi:O-antigen/teichoic acid export membrane protein